MENDVRGLIERLRDADQNSVQRCLGSRIFGEAADALSASLAREEVLKEALADIQRISSYQQNGTLYTSDALGWEMCCDDMVDAARATQQEQANEQ